MYANPNEFFEGIGLTAMTVPKAVMIVLALFLAYLAIVKKYEPLLLLPLAFGILIANIPLAGLSRIRRGRFDEFPVPRDNTSNLSSAGVFVHWQHD